MVIKGNSSPVVISPEGPHVFVVKSYDNKSDPLSIISVVKFETSSKERKSEVAVVGTFSGATEGKQDLVSYQAKKYKDNSYELKIDRFEPGEYGIIVSNPNALNNVNIVMACFSVK